MPVCQPVDHRINNGVDELRQEHRPSASSLQKTLQRVVNVRCTTKPDYEKDDSVRSLTNEENHTVDNQHLGDLVADAQGFPLCLLSTNDTPAFVKHQYDACIHVDAAKH